LFTPKRQLQAGWPDEFVKKAAKLQPNPFFVIINA
jgi:hypothetical protein